MKENPRVRAAHDALREVLFNEPLDVTECDVVLNALGVLYSHLPEAQ